jgi:hypothetical protein
MYITVHPSEARVLMRLLKARALIGALEVAAAIALT